MVVRGLASAVATAVGVAAAASAAQLGLGYGLGIVSWLADGTVLSDEAWIASLTWATWIAATSAIAGAIVGDRRTRATVTGPAPADRVTDLLWRLVLSVAAALGALLTVALVAIPARVVELADTSSPQTIAAGYAALGVLVGLVLGAVALTARAATANLIATSTWLWLLAVVAVVNGVATGGDWSPVPLGFWDFTASEPWFRSILLGDAAPALAAALVIGALAALPAARRGDGAAGVATSGIAGPLLLAAAYLLAQPSLVGASAEELSRHLVVPYVMLAGLVGSLLASLVRPRVADRAQSATGAATVTPKPASPSAATVPVPRAESAQGRPSAPGHERAEGERAKGREEAEVEVSAS